MNYVTSLVSPQNIKTYVAQSLTKDNLKNTIQTLFGYVQFVFQNPETVITGWLFSWLVALLIVFKLGGLLAVIQVVLTGMIQLSSPIGIAIPILSFALVLADVLYDLVVSFFVGLAQTVQQKVIAFGNQVKETVKSDVQKVQNVATNTFSTITNALHLQSAFPEHSFL